MPKLLHFILDGYHPDNEYKLLDIKDILPDYMNSDYQVISTSTDHKEHLMSNRMWFRYYSRVYVTKDENAGRECYSSMYHKQANGENLIWRKLARAGVPCFISPYNILATQPTEWMLGTDDSNKLIRGVLKKWYSKVSWIIRDGKMKRVVTDEVASALMPAVERDCKLTDPELLHRLKIMHSQPTNQEFKDYFFSEVQHKLIDQLYDITEKRLQGNLTELYERIIPELQLFMKEFGDQDNLYVHAGLGETDCMYHFRPYAEIKNDLLIPYIRTYLTAIIDEVKPDIIVISGDHNMTDNREFGPYSNRENSTSPKSPRMSEVVIDGVKYYMTKAIDTPIPIFLSHGSVVGGCVAGSQSPEYSEFCESLRSDCSEADHVDASHDLFPEYMYDAVLKLFNAD